MNRVLCVLLLLLCAGTGAFARDALEQGKIDYLIQSVEQLQDATFVRNGSDYNAQQAAEHMRTKLRFAGSRVVTVEDFIVCCGTGSSVTGTPYTIKFADGRILPSADFLHEKLAEYGEDGAR